MRAWMLHCTMSIHLRSATKCLPQSSVLVSLSEMPGDFSYQPPLRPVEGFEVPREQLRSNFKTLSRSSFELSSNPLPQMCGPEGNSEFLTNSQALPENNKKTETSRQKAAMGTTQPGRENQESWDICSFPYLLNFLINFFILIFYLRTLVLQFSSFWFHSLCPFFSICLFTITHSFLHSSPYFSPSFFSFLSSSLLIIALLLNE